MSLVTPPMGDPRPYLEMACTYAGGEDINAICGRPATMHLLWDASMENGLACDEHAAVALGNYPVYDSHPARDVCNVPDSVWLFSWGDDQPGRCAWQVDDDALVAAANAEVPVGAT